MTHSPVSDRVAGDNSIRENIQAQTSGPCCNFTTKLLKTVVTSLTTELTLIDIIVLIGYENNYSLKT